MATFTRSNHSKLQGLKAIHNYASNTIKVLLMRTGFTFNKDTHSILKNIKGTLTGSSNVSFVSSTKKITKATGGFTAAGFVVGNRITVTGTVSNNSTFNITAVSDTELTVTESLTDESNTSAVITCVDELASGNGYTANSKTLAYSSELEDDTNDLGEILFANCEWTASGGSIGPTPGACIVDDTSSDDTIIGYLDFGSEVTATNGQTLSLRQIAARATV